MITLGAALPALISKTMNAHKITATLTENGTLLLKGLPFNAGESVEIIILEQSKLTSSDPQTEYPLQGTVLRYNDPFEPAISLEDWEALNRGAIDAA